MDQEPAHVPPAGLDPREFALQLAVVADQLDERSAQAVGGLEVACAAIERETRVAARMLAAECGHVAAVLHAAEASRLRLLRVASVALLIGAIVAVAGAALAVESARRELDAIQRDQTLLRAINGADVRLCEEQLCARFVDVGSVSPASGYRQIAPR